MPGRGVARRGRVSYGDLRRKAACRAPLRTFRLSNRVPRFVQHELNADQARTRDSFGYEWTKLYPEHGHSTPEWQAERDIFLEYTRTVPSDFRGKLVLDGGCGNGRYAKLANDWGARVVAVDISAAVEIAVAEPRRSRRRRRRAGRPVQAAVPSGHLRRRLLGRRAAPHAGRSGAFQAMQPLVKPGGFFDLRPRPGQPRALCDEPLAARLDGEGVVRHDLAVFGC